MGTTGFSSSFSSSFSSAFNSVFAFNIHPILGAVLAGLGFWPKTERPPLTHPKIKAAAPIPNTTVDLELPVVPEKHVAELKDCAVEMKQMSHTAVLPILQPLRVIRLVEAGVPAANAAQMAGRMVISGRMSDVCAELDRLAA